MSRLVQNPDGGKYCESVAFEKYDTSSVRQLCIPMNRQLNKMCHYNS